MTVNSDLVELLETNEQVILKKNRDGKRGYTVILDKASHSHYIPGTLSKAINNALKFPSPKLKRNKDD